MDETWIYCYTPETKQYQNCEQKPFFITMRRKSSKALSADKVKASLFWDESFFGVKSAAEYIWLITKQKIKVYLELTFRPITMYLPIVLQEEELHEDYGNRME